MTRYAIKHKPTGKFLYEDEGGSFLVDESEGFISYGDKKLADELFDCYDDTIWTEDGEFPIEEFEVTKI